MPMNPFTQKTRGERRYENRMVPMPTEKEAAARLTPCREFISRIPAPEEWKVLFATEDITPDMWRKAVRVGVTAN